MGIFVAVILLPISLILLRLGLAWFNALLGLDFKPISYDTLWWFLVRVKPQAFKNLMARWLQALPASLRDQLLSIDGKRLRGVSDNEHISHLVELFAVGPCLVIAQERVPDKKCECIALPQLLQTVDIRGAIISLDAHYAYVPDLKLILKEGADYIVGIKGNQGTLEAEAHNYFTQAAEIGYEDETLQCYTTVDKGHGRIEIHHICVTQDLEWLKQKEEWNLKSLIEIRREHISGKQVEKGVLYYGSSREGTPQQFAKWIRGHWEIESMHYVMDVVFEEDNSLANTGHTAENMGLFRRLALNIIKTVDPKREVADARRNAAYEPAYLRGILSRLFMKNC